MPVQLEPVRCVGSDGFESIREECAGFICSAGHHHLDGIPPQPELMSIVKMLLVRTGILGLQTFTSNNDFLTAFIQI